MGRLSASAAAASAAVVCTAAASVADTDAVARKTDVTSSPIPALGVLTLPSHVDGRQLQREADRKLRAAKRHSPRRHPKKVAVSPALQAIANCESHGNPRAIGGGGSFRGKYQFDMGTWASVGGKGDPAAAPEAEQDRRAAMLYARSGSSPWPVCGS